MAVYCPRKGRFLLKITDYASDKEILTELGARLRDVRIAAPMTQKELAAAAGLSVGTVQALEAGKSVSLSALLAMLRTLGLLGGLEAMIPEQNIRPLQLVALGKKRERATSGKKTDSGWTWGDEQ